MDTLLWVLGSIVAVLVFAGVLPVLVLGTWWLVLNGVLKGIDGVWWILDQAERAERLLHRSPIPVEASGRLHGHAIQASVRA